MNYKEQSAGTCHARWLFRKASGLGGECVTRECRPCFQHGTREACVVACVCIGIGIGIVLKMRRRGVNLPAGGCSSCSRPLLSPLRMPHSAPASGIRVSHDQLRSKVMLFLSRPLSRRGSTGLGDRGDRDTPPRDLWAQAWLRGWLRGPDSIPTRNSAALGSLSRVQQNPEPRCQDGERRGGEGAASLGWRSPAPRP
jgi:hypothetical protein